MNLSDMLAIFVAISNILLATVAVYTILDNRKAAQMPRIVFKVEYVKRDTPIFNSVTGTVDLVIQNIGPGTAFDVLLETDSNRPVGFISRSLKDRYPFGEIISYVAPGQTLRTHLDNVHGMTHVQGERIFIEVHYADLKGRRKYDNAYIDPSIVNEEIDDAA